MKTLVLGFILLAACWAALSVDDPISCESAVYTVGLPVTLFLLLAVPTAFGYLAGKIDAMDDFSKGRF